MRDAVFSDRALYVERGDTLVLADLHVGRAEGSNVEFPLGGASDLTERIERLLSRFDPAEVVFAGDVLHQYGRLSDRVARSFADVRDCCRTAGARPVFVRGNHDAMLSSVWDGDIVDTYEIPLSDDDAEEDAEEEFLPAEFAGPVVVRHGHEAPPESEAERAGTYLIGHDHPTIEIEGRRRPCYLFVPDAVAGTPAVMLPAFNRLPAGVVVNGMTGSEFQSPFVTAADPLCPVVWDADAGERLAFPPLGELRRLL